MISVVGFLSMSGASSLIWCKNTPSSAKSIPDIEIRNDFYLQFVWTYAMDITYYIYFSFILFVYRLILSIPSEPATPKDPFCQQANTLRTIIPARNNFLSLLCTSNVG